MPHEKLPGVSREQRISSESLIRLEKQLVSGARMSAIVLEQWVKRYGDPARELIRKHRRSYQALDNDG